MKLLVVALLIGSCQPQPKPTQLGTLELPAAPCALGDAMPPPVTDCAKFVRGKWACVLCAAGAASCTDTLDMVYCANTCDDPLCRIKRAPMGNF